MHIKPTGGCQISTDPGNTFNLSPNWARTLQFLIYFSWDIYRDPPPQFFLSHKKYIKDGKVLAHFGLRLNVLPGSLTDVSF
jgi:hypothetical protein